MNDLFKIFIEPYAHAFEKCSGLNQRRSALLLCFNLGIPIQNGVFIPRFRISFCDHLKVS